MMTSVPQFIDVEDKVAGPFSWRQLGWMLGMGAVLFLLYTVLSRGFFFVAAVPVIMFFVALAFYRPHGMTLPRFIFYTLLFLFRPKTIVWERPVVDSLPRRAALEDLPPSTPEPEKKMTPDELLRLARSVDTRR
jgi:PrgI family protein